MTTDSEKYFWFLGTLTRIRVSAQDGENQLSIVEQRARKGYSPALHLHRTQDEIFQALAGEFRFVVGNQEKYLRVGDMLLIPRGTPHTYIITSHEDGRWLAITVGVEFENFVRAMQRPASRPEIPASGEDPSPENVLAVNLTASQFGIDIVGPRLEG